MKEHVMKYITLKTEQYFECFLNGDNYGAAWNLAIINAAYGYTEDPEVAHFTMRLHKALLGLSIERSKQWNIFVKQWRHVA